MRSYNCLPSARASTPSVTAHAQRAGPDGHPQLRRSPSMRSRTLSEGWAEPRDSPARFDLSQAVPSTPRTTNGTQRTSGSESPLPLESGESRCPSRPKGPAWVAGRRTSSLMLANLAYALFPARSSPPRARPNAAGTGDRMNTFKQARRPARPAQGDDCDQDKAVVPGCLPRSAPRSTPAVRVAGSRRSARVGVTSTPPWL